MSEPNGAVPAKNKDDKRKQTIIAVSAVLGVLLTYILIRRSQAASATGASTATPLSTASTATPATDATSTALGNISNQLGALTSQLTSQASAATATPAVDPNTNPGIGYGVNNTGNFLYDLKTATYGQVQSNGGIDWLTGTQAAVVGANQGNATKVSDAGRVDSSFQPTSSVYYTPPESQQQLAAIHANQQVP